MSEYKTIYLKNEHLRDLLTASLHEDRTVSDEDLIQTLMDVLDA